MTKNKLILCGACLAVFIFLFNSAPTAEAVTYAELQALIQSLQSQIADLQKQSSPKASWCHDFNVDLKLGLKSSEVLALKTVLIKEGYKLLKASSDEFEQETIYYVKAFQEKYRSEILTPVRLKYGNGFVGKGTRAKLNKLYGCQPASSAVPTTEATSSVSLLSPNGGDKLTQGTDYYIRWTSSGLEKVSIILINYSTGDQSEIANSVSAGSGQYLWKTPYTTINGDKYKISVKGGKSVDSSDNYFSIASAKKPLAPSLTLLSPVGGEQWQKGTTYSIKWLFQDLDKIDSIILTNYSKNESYSLGNNIGASLNSSAFDWAIPSPALTVPVGDSYRIKLESCIGSTCYSAQSANYFSIVSGTSLLGLEKNLADIAEAISRLQEAVRELLGR